MMPAVRVRILCVSLLVVLGAATPARADLTVFVGNTPSPGHRAVRGGAVGVGLLVVGFEFEYASFGESRDAPSLHTGSGNVLLQTPVAIFGVQPYVTTGAGLYRERTDSRLETHLSGNAGGGARIAVAGPLRLRVDYRVFTLKGDPTRVRVHRIYAGANLRF
jgi:hypothetical protein